MSDERNRPPSTSSAAARKAERASVSRQDAERRLTKRRRSERALARREAKEHRKAVRRSAVRRKSQEEAAEHLRAERALAAQRSAEHRAAQQLEVERDRAARREAAQEAAERAAQERRTAQQEAAEHRQAVQEEAARERAQREAEQRREGQRQQEAARSTSPSRARDERPGARSTGSTALLLLAGLAAGALVAIIASARRRTRTTSPVSERELELRDEQDWTYETTMVVYAPAGAIAGHVHDVGGLPGLVGPLDGPPMDRVDWVEPHGARLRFQVHARNGGGPSDTTVQIARGERTGPLTDLEAEVRDALASLRSTLERS